MAGLLVCVFGVSGVGKTTLMSRFVLKHHQWSIVSASKIIANDLQKNPEAMRTAELLSVDRNQEEIVAAIRVRRSNQSTANLLLDAHAVIDRDGAFAEVHPRIVQALEPNGIIVIVDKPAEIVRKRKNDELRLRPLRSVEEIAAQQARTLVLCAEYSNRVGVSNATVDANDLAGFSTAVNRVTLNRGGE